MTKFAPVVLALFVLSACSRDAGQPNNPDGLTYRDVDRPGKSHSPVVTAAGTMLYFGGSVIPNAKVYVVWWGNPANLNPSLTATTGGIADFYAGVTNSNYIDWLNEYNTTINAQAGSHINQPGTQQRIGRGNYAGTLTLTNIPSGNVTDAQIQSTLDQAFAAGTLPQPDENTLYAIYFPPNVTITLGTSQSCLSFGAYHEAIVETVRHNAYYSVMPDCGSSFSGFTNVSSHELIEAITDAQPTPGSNPDYPQAWNDSSGSEVGDLCQSSSGTVNTAFGTFTVQGEWDERSQGCKTFTTDAQDFNVVVSPNAATMSAGATNTFTVQTATVVGAAQALALSVTAPAGVTATLGAPSVTSGQSATLTVTASSATAAAQVVVRAGGGTSGKTHTAALLLRVTGAAQNDFSISASPSSVSVTKGNSVTTAISTAIVSGNAQAISFSAGGLPSGATASFNPAPVTAGGSSTMTIATTTSTATGTFSVTVTGTAASGSHTATVTLTVTNPAANDFSISANPTSVSLAQGASGSSTISTALTSGSAQTVALSASGAPAGVTASLTPSSVTAGQSATLNLAANSSAAPGTYNITVTGSATSGSHGAVVSLTITSSSGGGITNGGFETGNVSGWTVAGTAAAVSGGHSGSFAARVGSTTPSTDSSLSQTFTATSGATQLSFFYKVVCPDTITYDWASATLKDNTSGTSVAMLANTCSNSGAWVQATAGVTAGHGYTLTLANHDDNYASDPTYTLYDDVTLVSGPPPPPGGIANGDFEAGTSGWTFAGTTSIATAGCHGGSKCAQLGSTSPTNGDSNAAQTFTVPAGKSQLSIWYNITCPDTITYDWATVTLKNNGTGVTLTVLAKTCTNSGAWTNVTAAVTPGTSYTLTLTSHDDNFSGDPTHTLFDDVSLN